MKKAQVTIFVIVGIVLISIIGLFILFKLGKIPSIIGGVEKNPQVYLENCIEPRINNAVKILENQGGKINPGLFKTFKFNEDKDYFNISFLCYTDKNYLPCVNRNPILINSLEEEINEYIADEMVKCFADWKTSMEKNDFVVEMSGLSFDVELEPKKIILNAQKEISASSKGESFQYNEFRVVLPTKIYDLASVVQEIVSQEAKYCNFDIQGFMLFYPKFNIDKFRTSDLNTIYVVQDRASSEKFKFAVRSCVVAPGM